MTIGELLVEVGFNIDNTKVKDFIKSLGELDLKSALAVFGLDKAYDAIKKIGEMGLEAAHSTHAFTIATGQSGIELQKWSATAQQLGMSSGVVASHIESLGDAMTDLQVNGSGAGGWALLNSFTGAHINPTSFSNMFELTLRTLDSMKDLSIEQQRLVLKNLGWSTEWLYVIDEIKKGTLDINEQLAMSEKTTEQFTKFNRDWQKAMNDWKVALIDIFGILLPVLDALAKVIDLPFSLFKGLGRLTSDKMFSESLSPSAIFSGGNNNHHVNNSRFIFNISGGDAKENARASEELWRRKLSDGEYQQPLQHN